jgi:hypothetical protein
VSRFPYLCNYPWPITAEKAPRQYSLARLSLRWITFEMVWMLCGLQYHSNLTRIRGRYSVGVLRSFLKGSGTSSSSQGGKRVNPAQVGKISLVTKAGQVSFDSIVLEDTSVVARQAY